MISSDIQKMLPNLIVGLKSLPIKKAWLFGSCSRGEETKDSDMDILVQYDENSKISLMKIAHCMTVLGKCTNRRIDLVEDGQLLPFAIESANRDKILIYEREGA